MAAVAASAVGAVVTNVVALSIKLAEKRMELSEKYHSDIDSLKTELLMIAGAEEDELSWKGGDPSAKRRIYMKEMHELAFDIEDCLDRILRDTEEKGRAWFNKTFPPYAKEVEQLKTRLKDAHQRSVDYRVNGSHLQPPAAATPTASTHVAMVVGIEEPKRELLDLLDLDEVDGELRVISIVGFGGSGKSTLAKVVYNLAAVSDRFSCRAWVVASGQHNKDGTKKALLTTLLEKLDLGRGGDDAAAADVEQLQADIKNHLTTRRYLIVLDDIEEQQWNSIKSTFPADQKSSSRIIVRTTVQAVGKVCSDGRGHVYNMGTLDLKHSNDLLEAVLENQSPVLVQISKSIVNKCDGHPLALVSVANYLLRKDELTEQECEEICRSLGYYMEKEEAFTELQQMLLNNYSSLPGHILKNCLLYLSVLPNGHSVNRNSLVRRWIAEGYVQGQHPRSARQVADANFEELIGRNIIRPIDRSSKNAKAKTCKAHGIMHEFMLHMSTSAKFITSLDDPERRSYRHLFMDNSSCSRALDVNNHSHTAASLAPACHEKFRARSFTVCGSACREAVKDDIAKCELLRVLDLEECLDLKDDDMEDIHKLRHLKYLSLGATISRFPCNIEKLHCLETFDARRTKIETLPVEVFKLPYLTHLLGKFKLRNRDWKTSEVAKLFPKPSNIQTLAGLVTDDNYGVPLLMGHMGKLRKVNIWCNEEGTMSLACLSTAIMKFMQREVNTGTGVCSLSLHGNSTGMPIISAP